MALNKETGEITEDHDVTIKLGDREVHTTVEGLEQAADSLNHNQLTLFEGHRVDLLELKLKGASIGGAVITPDIKVPRYHEVRYFIVEAKVCRITHHDKILGEDELLKKTAVFEIEAIAEADEFTAMRMLKKDGE